ncbi:MAG TPA: triose-phosphate isomerase [Candidatus Nanoarchaeia archaeon]|nr:triose-phosphate isomerase [Candidatus Nanoarchaeia archaeon]
MKKLIVANWKMNKTVAEAVSTADELKKLAGKEKNVDLVICPAFTALYAVAKELIGSNIKLGAQNMHFESAGAYTGDISPLMLKDIGCEYAILGHSERREFFKEDDSLINKKILSALKHSIKPILCVGETWNQRENNQTKSILGNQLEKGLNGVSSAQVKNITIAYEPVWAISRGNPNQKAATPEDAEAAHDFIRNVLEKMFDKKISTNSRILYGGSMKPENAKELLSRKDIDGGLVGNASLNAKNFYAIIKAAK